MLTELLKKKFSRGYVASANPLANNGILGHDFEVLCRDDVPVSSGSYEYIGTRRSILHGGDLVTSHGGLESVNGINFGDKDTSAV